MVQLLLVAAYTGDDPVWIGIEELFRQGSADLPGVFFSMPLIDVVELSEPLVTALSKGMKSWVSFAGSPG